MLIGYARVSTDDQKLDLQLDALKKAGCERIFDDRISGAKSDRPGLREALNVCRSGDTLVVWRLDRLGRSLKDLIAMAETLKEQGIGFKSITESIDTTTPGGQLIFHMFGALAEFERNLIRERVNAGLSAARARGKVGGRPKLLDANKQQLAVDLYAGRKHSIKEICEMLGVSKTTLYAYLDGHLDKQKPKVESVTH
jgi:DNA invertase Pin-like site-specific DNA recombinase